MKSHRPRKPSSDNQGWKRSYKKVETAIQKEHIAHVKEVYDVLVVHIPNEGDVKPQYRKQLLALGLEPGIHDIFYMWAGNIIFHELKSTIGKLSKRQKEVHAKVIDYGFLSVTTYGLEQAKKIPLEYNFPKRT